MAAFSMDIPMKAVNVCEAFARGECQFGQNCAKDHPPQLSPGCQREVEFEFSRDHFTGCERCVTQGFPCDKPSRPKGEEHPCSECRQFGGSSARCVPFAQSRNDAMWGKMLEDSTNFALPAYRARDAARSRKGIITQPCPMPADKVAPGWQGESKERLLAKGNPIPDQVRAKPRAYLTPPPLTTRRKDKTAHFHSTHGTKRKADEANRALTSQAQASRADMPYSMPSYGTPGYGMSGYGTPGYGTHPMQGYGTPALPYSMPSYRTPNLPIPGRDSRGAHAERITVELKEGSVYSTRVSYPGINGEQGQDVVHYPTQMPQGYSFGVPFRPQPTQAMPTNNRSEPAPKKPRPTLPPQVTSGTSAQPAPSSTTGLDVPSSAMDVDFDSPTAPTGSAPSTTQPGDDNLEAAAEEDEAPIAYVASDDEKDEAPIGYVASDDEKDEAPIDEHASDDEKDEAPIDYVASDDEK
ncbi:hypothetical protein KC331_g2871 [Hortaea werneckii]|uniref:C3H1-type domain-containing protein n=1 Tax=Hortaea werneckii TaxID=91943 RepID=A0A3M7BJM3_HORWE|nr:hypothetical protein KC331_g2871 [Hortaea werneckii]KAI7719886.1 hypothetical protein KC353_g2623 [Hortaea werneckii]RMY39737.1 hypothetical protein D0865_12740 [Hortaea werneckii]